MIAAEEQENVEGKSSIVASGQTTSQTHRVIELNQPDVMRVDQLSNIANGVVDQLHLPLDGDRATGKVPGNRVKPIEVCLLTGGDDRPYALGMASTLASRSFGVDFIGSNKLDAPELHSTPLISFLNLRGDQREDAPFRRKFVRILAYYGRLLKYVLRARPRIFHILWNNKFEHVDRTLLMLYYRLFRKRIVFTAHNVNTRKRDGRDSWLNRLSLRIQYRLCHQILVHTAAMKDELVTDFGIPASRVTIIPFGINNTCPSTPLDRCKTRERFNFAPSDKVLLFFGQIAPYKGLEYLVSAFIELAKQDADYRLLIAGKVKKGYAAYWNEIQSRITASEVRERVLARIEHIPDAEVEWYFKAADVVVIPYAEIFQSGVPFLSYSFGLPVIATDVGSLRDDIIEGETGFLCQPKDPVDLSRVIATYFASDLYKGLEMRRSRIQAFANKRYSWNRVGEILDSVYRQLLSTSYPR
jgi:glycosyltransferase involved in cell wall biosynthesis